MKDPTRILVFTGLSTVAEQTKRFRGARHSNCTEQRLARRNLLRTHSKHRPQSSKATLAKQALMRRPLVFAQLQPQSHEASDTSGIRVERLRFRV